MKLKLSACLVLSSILFSASCFANSTNTNVSSSASISPKCTVSSTRIDFGSISPRASGTSTATSNITALCTQTTIYTISVGGGSSGDILHRTLLGVKSGNTDSLLYNVYLDTSYGTIVGDGSQGTSVLSGTGSGILQNYTIYGLLQLNQYITPDQYQDNLSVTINY